MKIKLYIIIDKSKIIHKNNRLVLKSEQRFRREKHEKYTEEVNEITLSANGGKRIQSNDSMET